ncbi:hypothetical protein O6H91_Y419800 [Diphasiastrum complanatum]|nr:hypothetical protein O6H91_Y419800 [Diphasiastrum complanatum]
MPGLLTYRRGSSTLEQCKANAANTQMNFQPKLLRKDAEGGTVPEYICFHNTSVSKFSRNQNQIKEITSNRSTGIASKRMADRMGSKVLYANGGHDVGNHDSHLDVNTACLAEMVHGFLEDYSEVGKCGRARCNCEIDNINGACVAGDDDEDSTWENLTRNVKDLSAHTTDLEKEVFSDVTKIISTWRNEAGPFGEADRDEFTKERQKHFLVTNLLAAGYNAALCKSTWNRAQGLPGGKYVYVDIVLEGENKEEERRLIIDLEFRSEFDIARPTKQYRSILQDLPVIFVGGPERLQRIVNVMCDCVKISVSKSGMSLPPWRKPVYMRAKWFSPYKRTTPVRCYHERNNVGRILNNIDPSPILFLQQSEQKPESTKQSESEMQAIGSFIFEGDVVGAAKRERSKELEKGHDRITVVSTNWQLPAAGSRSSRKMPKAGLASLLMEAGWITWDKRNPISMNTKLLGAADCIMFPEQITA